MKGSKQAQIEAHKQRVARRKARAIVELGNVLIAGEGLKINETQRMTEDGLQTFYLIDQASYAAFLERREKAGRE